MKQVLFSVNIHSHISGALIFIFLPYSTVSQEDLLVFSFFSFGVAVCFLLSANPRVSAITLQFNFLGIIILMWGSAIPTIYYGFYCDVGLQKNTTILSLNCFIITILPNFRGPTFRTYRDLMFSCLGFSIIFPVSHGVQLYGLEIQEKRMVTLNLFGVASYAPRVLERFFPRKHDIYGSSHQILHVMVVLAGLAHMTGLLSAFDYLHSQAVPCGWTGWY
ncbi:hypothetical protein L873DRAFT_1880924 [Choiromyces venosus 120613-1]|uniref:Hly-III related protein n=1 Tax=Choiromyces venosus 120613-1 TaxID=1336337 RepID=A0A3N4JVA2_9PEZI|nr:hypothetical protein L873DRAFT_1880924 [Choiromyces venosus 120613-1]